MAPVGPAITGQLPPQAVIYGDTWCHRHVPAGAPFAHPSSRHASTGWGATPLALDGDAPLTLQSIGERLGITRERVRQLQDRALERMCRRRVPSGVRQYARQAIAAVLNQAESAGAETGESLLTLAEAALPAVPVALAARVLAQLAGHSRQVSKHVAGRGGHAACGTRC